MSTTVTLQPYNASWPTAFEQAKKSITTAIGAHILAVEHIGSTAIPGMHAKPILDILVGIENINEITHIIAPLQKIGFEYVPASSLPDRKFFRKGLWGQGTQHVHICEMNSSEWQEKITFRDALRADTQLAAEYAALKAELAEAYKNDRPSYTKMKEPFIHDVLTNAKKSSTVYD